MKKHLTLVLAAGALMLSFSSCKKTTDLSIITGHKWELQSATATFSDSTGISHNLMAGNIACPSPPITEFQNYAPNSHIRLAYTYVSVVCGNNQFFSLPNLGITAWDMDPDNMILYVDGSTVDGTGGYWLNITTLNGSSLVLSYVFQNQIGQSTGGSPLYDTETQTVTYTAQ